MPKSVFMKFTLTFVLVALLPLTFFIGVTLQHFSVTLQESALDNIAQTVFLTGDTMNLIVRDLNAITRNMYIYERAIYGTLREWIVEDERYEQREGYNLSQKYIGMRDFTQSMLDASGYLVNVVFWDARNNKAYARSSQSGKLFDAAYDFRMEEHVRQALQTPRALVVSKPHAEGYYVRSEQRVITFARAFLDVNALPDKEVVLGVLLMDVDYRKLYEVLAHTNWDASGVLYLLTSDDTCIYSNKPEYIGERLPLLREAQTDHTQGLLTDEREYIAYKQIPQARWTVVFSADRAALLRRIRLLQGYAYVMIAISAAGALLLAIWCSRRLAKPIRRIAKQMRRVEAGDLTVRVEAQPQGDELGQLALGFNHMVEELSTYINRSYVAKLRQKEAELNELKTQIHPHFLYNTLEVIRMTALEADDRVAAEMIEALAKQFHYLIGEISDTVPLGQELDMVRSYIGLISRRYGKISLFVDVPPALRSVRMLKLSLQPVVENAVLHGLKPRAGGTVQISAKEEGGRLELCVMDNGIGMSERQVTEIRALLQTPQIGVATEEGWSGIGLKNVYDRIRLACGDSYGLEIHSEEGLGTLIKIHLPLRMPQAEGSADEAVDCR